MFDMLYKHAKCVSYNKRDELYMHILEHKYDIVGLSETWANDNISDT